MEQKLRLGIVGTGMIANVIAEAVKAADGCQLAAVSSRRLETAEEFSRNHGIERPFGSWQEMVASEVVDAIYVATPTAAREEVCLAAAQNGKHVLGEKPFSSHASRFASF